jgi:thioredoxin reductase (NADPH)
VAVAEAQLVALAKWGAIPAKTATATTHTGEEAMAEYVPPVLRARWRQMYFPLTDAELGRLRRFGVVRHFARDDFLIRAGETGLGMIVLLRGRATVSRRDGLGHHQLVTVYPRHHFIAESGQLSGCGSFVDARADSPVEALVVSPQGLRDIVIAEAELGERILRALVLRRVGLIESGAGGPLVIGPTDHPDMLRLQNFMTRNGVPYRVLAPGAPEADALLAKANPQPADQPLVLCPAGALLTNPTERRLAEAIGMLPPRDPAKVYDVAIVGAGPAGLASAVYAASEGLSVVVLEAHAFGGQAGASSRIENYLGFPTGIRGGALAGRAFVQAQKFGADIVIPASVTRLKCAWPAPYELELAEGPAMQARTVVVASGAQYRHPDLRDLNDAEADGVHYWASPIEANLCAGQEVVLVGGGNSAGQAAVFLATRCRKVWMLVRGLGLKASMSQYLIDRIKAQPNIEVLPRTEIARLDVDAAGALCTAAWRQSPKGVLTERPIRHLFLFIGAVPSTDWLKASDVTTDDRGFVLTGKAARPDDSRPLTYMTSLEGVFAVGDLRSGSAKRVAAAVGEGAAMVGELEAFLAASDR